MSDDFHNLQVHIRTKTILVRGFLDKLRAAHVQIKLNFHILSLKRDLPVSETEERVTATSATLVIQRSLFQVSIKTTTLGTIFTALDVQNCSKVFYDSRLSPFTESDETLHFDHM